MEEQQGEQSQPIDGPPQSPVVLISTAMGMVGLTSAKQQRTFTAWSVGGLFAVVFVLMLLPVFCDMTDRQAAAADRFVKVATTAMIALVGLQAVRNNKDAHKGNHDIRNEMVPIKSGVELVEQQTNGKLTERLQNFRAEITADFAAQISDVKRSLTKLADAVAHPQRTAGREFREPDGE